MSDQAAALQARLTGVYRELALDSLALRVIDALRAAGLEVLLMKGPVTRSWLYEDGEQHPYTDVDLLVRPTDERAATAVMTALGLQDLHSRDLNLYTPLSERAWLAAEGVVDLHIGLVGIPDSRWADVWDVLAADSEPFPLRGRPVPIMNLRGRVFHLALHASQRASGAKAAQDLERACAATPLETWSEAAALASELEAVPAFASGLRSVVSGARIAAELELPRAVTTLSVLHARGASAEAIAMANLWSLPRRRRFAAARGWFEFGTRPASAAQGWRLRGAAIRRFPAALRQWFTAAWSARAPGPETRRSTEIEGG